MRNYYFVSRAKKLGSFYGLSDEDSRRLYASLGLLAVDTELKLEITIWDEKKENERVRTEQQNKYYHKLLDIICDYTGEEHMEMHQEFKIKFLSRPWIKGDKEYCIVKSTRDLTSKEFGSYLEQIFSYASAELGLVLPSSSEYYSIQ